VPLSDEQKKQFDLLTNTHYVKVFSGMAMNMAAPFWWSGKDGDNPAKVLGNGTLCYLNTGTRHIGVTCDHVYQGYLEAREKHSGVEVQFGNNTIEPDQRLIDRSPIKALDLATFDVPETFVGASLRNYHHNALKWPPDPLTDKDVVLYGGYPQVLRNPKTLEVEFPFQYFITRVNSADDKTIVLEPGIEHLYWPGHEGEPINSSWGGQSGGPVYRVIDATPDKTIVADRLELVGFIDRDFLGKYILAKPARLVRPDGTLEQG
jgi:hypothetical protein